MNESILYRSKRDKKEFKVLVSVFLISYLISSIYISVLFSEYLYIFEDFVVCMLFFLPNVIITILVATRKIRNKWICTALCIMAPFVPFTVSDIYERVRDLLFLNVIIGAIFVIVLIRRVHIGSGFRLYLDAETTPLKWLWFTRHIRVPLAVLTSASAVLSNIAMSNSGQEVHWLDIVFPTLLIISSIVAFVGLRDFKKYGLVSYICFFTIPVIYNLSIVMLYMTYGLDISKVLAQSTGSIVFFVLEGIYFWKRRFLFVPYDAELDEPIETKIIKKPVVKQKESINLKFNTTDNKTRLEEIKQLKELLDMGAITQEEYDEKKKTILEKIY